MSRDCVPDVELMRVLKYKLQYFKHVIRIFQLILALIWNLFDNVGYRCWQYLIIRAWCDRSLQVHYSPSSEGKAILRRYIRE